MSGNQPITTADMAAWIQNTMDKACVTEAVVEERNRISAWLRSLDKDEAGEINRFLPTTLANWIDEEMHLLGEK